MNGKNTKTGTNPEAGKTHYPTVKERWEIGLLPINVEAISMTFMGGFRITYKDGRQINVSGDTILSPYGEVIE